MDDMEKRVHNITVDQETAKKKSQEGTSPSYPPEEIPAAMDLSLVPSQTGFVPGHNQEFHQQPMHIITEGTAAVGDSHWTEWGSWANCFCGKQVRTRRCIYSSAMSSGCQGNSYESRSCTGGWCPVPTETTRPEVTTTKMPQVPSEKPSDPLRHFRPLQLHTATSLS
ncbi:hypothetical protein ANCCAN_24160 [Ancylostoma caninum]|uniref:Thrombospondin type 1 domain protein n=1 Tax=Ancylostoma caninum TaxID=29170 RepID=A0A368FGF1_ANCCA|nr:hypothetical protein ANCCAN_24160 [Ancylostoma caninum]